MRKSKPYDVIIIGSGPAGLTAGIYASRSGLDTLLIAGSVWGGQLMFTEEVENFPGFSEGVLGHALIERMRKQAEKFGTEILFKEATEVDFSNKPFKVKTRDKEYSGHSVIIATGSSPKWLGLESEARLRGRGVSTCATCDAPLFKGRRTAVVGGGDAAIEEALVLAKFAEEVTVIHRRDELRATRLLQERAFKNDKIRFLWNTVVQDILGKERVVGLRLKNVKTEDEFELAVEGVFIAIGYEPNTKIFRGKIELDERGYIVVHEETRTNIEGIFAAGDVKDSLYRQAITAAGDGCKAALDAERFLKEYALLH